MNSDLHLNKSSYSYNGICISFNTNLIFELTSLIENAKIRSLCTRGLSYYTGVMFELLSIVPCCNTANVLLK